MAISSKSTSGESARFHLSDYRLVAWHNFRVARQNEAAGAADAARGRGPGFVILPSDKVGSQGGPCDPSTKNHAGGTPATSLLRGYHTTLYPLGGKIRATLPLLSRSPQHATYSGIPCTTLHRAEAVARLGHQPSVRPADFLHSDVEKAVEHCRHSLSEETPPSTHDSQSGRSSPTHRCGLHTISSNYPHDPLCHRCSGHGAHSLEGQRH